VPQHALDPGVGPDGLVPTFEPSRPEDATTAGAVWFSPDFDVAALQRLRKMSP
jgi:hypothetical protein